MNPRTKNLAIAAGAVIAVGFVGVNTLLAPAPATPVGSDPASTVAAPATSPGALSRDGGPPDGTSVAEGAPASGAAVPSPGSVAGLVDPAAARGSDRRSYAIGLQDLAGLAPDTPSGARLELWVTWEPPITREPRLQKLIGDVVLERTIPGSVPEAPVTVLLSVPADRAGDLIYADGYGRLSVVLPG